MSDLKQARVLLMSAKRDISALHGMADASVFADEIFGFHAQQAAEKLLKAWLALLGETYPTIHDLARHSRLLLQAAAQPDGITQSAVRGMDSGVLLRHWCMNMGGTLPTTGEPCGC